MSGADREVAPIVGPVSVLNLCGSTDYEVFREHHPWEIGSEVVFEGGDVQRMTSASMLLELEVERVLLSPP